MTTPVRILSATAILLCLAIAVAYLGYGSGADEPGAAPSSATGEPSAQGAEGQGGAVQPLQAGAEVERREPGGNNRERLDVAGPLAARDAPQGITGTVLDPALQPLAGVRVYLVESPLSNLLERYYARDRNVLLPPSVQTTTAEDGSFELGVSAVAEDKSFEVRIVDDRFADHATPDIKILQGDWFDLGRITLSRGVAVRGRITLAGTSVPIAGAVVRMTLSNFVELVTIPGRENGIEVTADSGGFYEIPNAPADRRVDLSAVAPGFARETRAGLSLESDRINVIDFALPRGTTLVGRVVDMRGQPIADAAIKGHCMNPKANHTEVARSDPNGRFEMTGLREEKYHLVAYAQDYQTRRHGPVDGGASDVLLALEAKGSAGVRVVDPDGTLVREYRLAVRQRFEGGVLGMVRDVSPRRIVARDLQRSGSFDGVALIHGLDTGSYVFEVEADGYAKSFSPPVDAIADGSPAIVELELSPGAELVGEVVDIHNQPVAGAEIRSQADGYVSNAFMTALGTDIPTQITERTIRSDRDGRYRLPRMAAGTYQLLITHPDACERTLTGIEAASGTVQVPRAVLLPGTVVSGVVRLNGTPTGQIKVVLAAQSPANPRANPAANPAAEAAPGAAARGFSTEAITDNSGRFTLAKRVPPGTYEIKAARQTSGDLFTPMLDFKRSARPLVVGDGAATLPVDIDIPAQ